MTTVCFAQYSPTIRVYKQSKVLKQLGYKTILICEKSNYLFDTVFDEVKFYGKIPNRYNEFGTRVVNWIYNRTRLWKDRIKDIISKTDADIYHVHAEPNNVPRIVMENTDSPVIFDAQDFSGISFGLDNLPKNVRDDEKYCLEHADGICHKASSFEIDYYRQNGYNISCPELQWLDYCDESIFYHSDKKLSNEDNEIHLVHTGTISPCGENRYKYLVPLGVRLSKQKIHLHVYPANMKEYDLAIPYHTMESNNGYFHIHKPIRYEKLPEEISKYDFHSHILENHIGDMFTPEKQRVSMGNKLFSSLEGGLPMIVSSHLECVRGLTEKYKIGVSIHDNDIKNISNIIKSLDYKELESNVLKTRERLSLKNQSYKLEEFYKKVMKK